MNAFELAGLAEVSSPDTKSSAGAVFLLGVHSCFQALLEENHDGCLLSDCLTEAADGCVPIYTHELWSVFVDLCAYSEEDELGEGTMEDRARLILFNIAERLLQALWGRTPHA